MNSFKISLPEIICTENAHTVFYNLRQDYKSSFADDVEHVIFDFSICKEISPVGLIYISMWRDELVSKGKKTFYRKSNPKTYSFLKKMHLFPNSEGVEDASVVDGYFYDIHRCMSTTACGDAHKHIISNVVQRDSVHDETYSAIDYMLNEIWDNAGVHGYGCYETFDYPKPVYICALEKDDYYEISIGDRGQGIYQSLHQHNPDIQTKNRKETIKAAIVDGISGHPDGSPGFGLFCAASFMRSGKGCLHLWSSNCYLVVNEKNDRIYSSVYSLGTLVSFIIRKSDILPFNAIVGGRSNVDDYIADVIGGMFDE